MSTREWGFSWGLWGFEKCNPTGNPTENLTMGQGFMADLGVFGVFSPIFTRDLSCARVRMRKKPQ
ncbi:hypothetical protein Mnod_4252 [Methylobacterium nodulans ORS 2060]|uniref:Uncharacterized protein n=1 Tax=Methylobacterium nodulans (strain LMG 21967 / CNCM I-2342 / ORS 2060) TaxID=460265 RepID=B8IA65_METNO|nr:hypothetical protein Mnod_4252 [Methylobacterium nodulans ORS 2060]